MLVRQLVPGRIARNARGLGVTHQVILTFLPGRCLHGLDRTGAQREALARQVPFWAEWTPAGDEIAWVRADGVAVAVRLVRPDGTGERAIYGTGGIPEAQVITVDFGTLRF